MVERNRDYVGVCGPYNVEETKEIASLMRKSGFTMETSHIPMIGFHVSWKSLEYGFSEGNRRVPPFKQLPEMLESVKGGVFSTIHYYTNNPKGILQELKAVLNRDSIYKANLVGGVQINGMLPSPKEIMELKEGYPELKIVLETSPKSTNGTSTEEIARRLSKNYYYLDYIIFDSSLGRGIEIDTDKFKVAYNVFKEEGIKANMVFAGGLNGSNVLQKAAEIKEMVGGSNFSLDVTTGVRDKKGEGYGNDVINMEKVGHYLRSASKAFPEED